MTTKPKARKFRIKRTPTQDAAASAPQEAAAQQAAPAADVASPAQVASENSIDAIRQEGLTGRQLRMARRVAQKHGLAPTSDFDAVRLLRAKGIDPFQRSNMLELVVPNAGEGAQQGQPQAIGRAETAKVQLPQTVQQGGANLPSTELSPAERRARDIQAIQRDIMQRRRKKLGLLMVRLAFFVMLPTLMAGYYFYSIATPMYATESEFLIIQNEGSGGASPLGGLLPTQFATNQDAIGVQAFLESKEAMLRLDRDVGFKSHFSQDWIDPIQRLGADPSDQDAYDIYKKNVKIGYDPTEGLIRMEVAAADPQVSAEFSQSLISYAEERVNNLSSQKREDQMRDARESFDRAQEERRAAQENLVRLQIEGQILDPDGVISSLRAQINTLETQVIEKEIELAGLLNNARPNQSRVAAAEGEVRILQEQLRKLNAKMVDVSRGENSLAELSARLQIAQADLAAADGTLQAARQTMEQARVEAFRQVRYLTVAVEPIAPDAASYPRAFENTILAFIVFAGIYLMISITASILREQVSA
ncbi:MAG: capsule biosynthesis protein [Pseudomonadota bacterium]